MNRDTWVTQRRSFKMDLLLVTLFSSMFIVGDAAMFFACGTQQRCTCFPSLRMVNCISTRPPLTAIPKFRKNTIKHVRRLVLQHNWIRNLKSSDFDVEMWPALQHVDIRENPTLNCDSLDAIPNKIRVSSDCPPVEKRNVTETTVTPTTVKMRTTTRTDTTRTSVSTTSEPVTTKRVTRSIDRKTSTPSPTGNDIASSTTVSGTVMSIANGIKPNDHQDREVFERGTERSGRDIVHKGNDIIDDSDHDLDWRQRHEGEKLGNDHEKLFQYNTQRQAQPTVHYDQKSDFSGKVQRIGKEDEIHSANTFDVDDDNDFPTDKTSEKEFLINRANAETRKTNDNRDNSNYNKVINPSIATEGPKSGSRLISKPLPEIIFPRHRLRVQNNKDVPIQRHYDSDENKYGGFVIHHEKPARSQLPHVLRAVVQLPRGWRVPKRSAASTTTSLPSAFVGNRRYKVIIPDTASETETPTTSNKHFKLTGEQNGQITTAQTRLSTEQTTTSYQITTRTIISTKPVDNIIETTSSDIPSDVDSNKLSSKDHTKQSPSTPINPLSSTPATNDVEKILCEKLLKEYRQEQQAQDNANSGQPVDGANDVKEATDTKRQPDPSTTSTPFSFGPMPTLFGELTGQINFKLKGFIGLLKSLKDILK